jgi:hypothetical protein
MIHEDSGFLYIVPSSRRDALFTRDKGSSMGVASILMLECTGGW